MMNKMEMKIYEQQNPKIYMADTTRKIGKRIGLDSAGWEWIRGVGCRGVWITKDNGLAHRTAEMLFVDIIKLPY